MLSDMESTLPDIASMTIAEYQARIIEKCAHFMGLFVMSTPEDRLRWRPAIDEKSKTRSILDQVGECIFANQRFVHYLRSETPPPAPEEWDTFANADEAVAILKESATKLAAIVRTMSSEDLARTYNTHRGPMLGALMIQFPVRNMTYHMGQINFIQLLYGDAEFHIDQEFVTL